MKIVDFITDPVIMKLIVKINDHIFIIGGYVTLIGWWFTLSNTITVGAYIMSACVLFGVIASILVSLYFFIKGKLDK
jgi:hypothetical protein